MTGLRLVRFAVATLAGAALAVPLGVVMVSPIVPVPLRLLLGALWLAALILPPVAVAGLALVAPFGGVLPAVFDAAPVQYTEMLVLALLGATLLRDGWAMRGREGEPAPAPTAPALTAPALMFGAVVLCSLAVGLVVSQVGLGVHWQFVDRLATLLARDYLLSPPGQWAGITAGARLLEGVGLLFVAARLERGRMAGHLTLLRAMTVAAAATALLAIIEAVQAAYASPSFHALVATLLSGRFTVHVADTNAAGSYDAMIGFVAVGLALDASGRRPRRYVWGAIAIVLFAAMWLSGSRAAVVSVAAVLVVAAIAATRGRSVAWPHWSLTAAAVVVGVAGVLMIGLDPRAVARRSLFETISGRAAFAVTGVQMIAAAPLFGAGIGRYFETSGHFMPSSIYWFHFHENAHNNFLQIGGELGLVGLLTFTWLLGAAAVRAGRSLRAPRLDFVDAGMLAGLGAFVVTWLFGHPLLTPEVAVPFWLLAGAAVARGDRSPTIAPVSVAAAVAEVGPVRRYGVAIVIVALAATVPLRARAESAALNLSEQSFGFYEWEGDPATGRFRWTTPSAAFFVAPHTDELDVPLCAAWADHRPDTTVVTFAIDGRVFHRLETRSGAWVTVRLRLPPALRDAGYRRVDVTTAPAWSPAEVLGTRDSRVLGVQMGAVAVR